MKKILIISDFNVNENSFISHLRLYDFAEYLSRENKVTLFLPIGKNEVSFSNSNFTLIEGDAIKLEKAYKTSDALIVNGSVFEKFDFIKLNKPVIYDGYDPFSFEEMNKDAIKKIVTKSDYFLCASERQKNYWIGMLSVYNRVNPIIYREDNKLKNIIDVLGIKYTTSNSIVKNIEDFVLCELDEDTDIELIIDCFKDLKDIDLKIICKDNRNLHKKYGELFNGVNENIFLIRYIDENIRNEYISKAKIILNICKDTLSSRFKPKDNLADYLRNKKIVICSSFSFLPDDLENKKGIIMDGKNLKKIIYELMNDDNLCKEYLKNLDVFISDQEDYLKRLDDIVKNLKIASDKNYISNKSITAKKDVKSNIVFLKDMLQKGIKMVLRD